VALAMGLDYLMHGVGTAFKGAMLCKMTTKSFFLAASSNLFVAVSTSASICCHYTFVATTRSLPLKCASCSSKHLS
jgi:hypothetical protein